jgi:hypothetical protein
MLHYLAMDDALRLRKQTALNEWINDRSKDLQSAAKGTGPSIWDRLGQYPEDWSLGSAMYDINSGGASTPLNHPGLEALDQRYQKALETAKRTGKVPSGWQNQ